MKQIKHILYIALAALFLVAAASPTFANELFTKQVQPNYQDFYTRLTQHKDVLTDLINNCISLYKQGNIPEKSQSFSPYPADFPALENLSQLSGENGFCIRIAENKIQDEQVYVAVPINGGEIHTEMQIYLTEKTSANGTTTISPCAVRFAVYSADKPHTQDIDLYL